jgi:hypothetical protein
MKVSIFILALAFRLACGKNDQKQPEIPLRMPADRDDRLFSQIRGAKE